MWYILILYFVGVFFWNIYVKEYDDDCDCYDYRNKN